MSETVGGLLALLAVVAMFAMMIYFTRRSSRNRAAPKAETPRGAEPSAIPKPDTSPGQFGAKAQATGAPSAQVQRSHEAAALAGAQPSQQAVRLVDQLGEALLRDIPADWNVFRSHNFTYQQLAAILASSTNNLVLECLPFLIPYPASWSIQLDPRDKGQRAWIRRIFVPSGSRDVSEGKVAATSPAFQLIATTSSSSTEEGVLDSWDGPDEGKGFQDYTVRESERITLNGTRMIARVFDFTRPTGRWRSLMTLRAGNGFFYYFDVSRLMTLNPSALDWCQFSRMFAFISQ